MAKIYFHYFEIIKHHKPLAELWYKTPLEEENHALQFKLALKVKTGLVENAKSDLLKVESALNTVKSIMENIKASPPSTLDALRSSLNLERKLAEFHVDCLASFGESSQREMFQAMMQADKGQVQVLEKTYQNLLTAEKKDRPPVAAS